jgi:hypothetical protein
MRTWVLFGAAFLALAAPAVAFSQGALSTEDAAGVAALVGFLGLIGAMLTRW